MEVSSTNEVCGLGCRTEGNAALLLRQSGGGRACPPAAAVLAAAPAPHGDGGQRGEGGSRLVSGEPALPGGGGQRRSREPCSASLGVWGGLDGEKAGARAGKEGTLPGDVTPGSSSAALLFFCCS